MALVWLTLVWESSSWQTNAQPLSLQPWLLYSWDHWATMGWLGKRLLGIHTKDHPTSSLSYPLVNIHIRCKYFHICLPIQRSLSTCLFLRLYCHQFSIHAAFKSVLIQPNHWLQHMCYYRLVPLTIFPSTQNEQQGYTAWNSAHWKGFPSPLSLRDIPQRGCSVVIIHFWVTPASTECRTIYKLDTGLLQST